jgi:hypothetical protein
VAAEVVEKQATKLEVTRAFLAQMDWATTVQILVVVLERDGQAETAVWLFCDIQTQPHQHKHLLAEH